MIIRKEEFRRAVSIMIESFINEATEYIEKYGCSDISMPERVQEKIEIFIDRYEINSEKEIIAEVQNSIETVISRFIKL
jgi:hypothetical protein